MIGQSEVVKIKVRFPVIFFGESSLPYTLWEIFHSFVNISR